jgi:hypothetical protein
MFKRLAMPGQLLIAIIGLLVITSACAMKESGADATQGLGRRSLVQYGQEMPISDELARFLNTNEIVLINLTNPRGEVLVFNPSGKEVKPCGTVEGTQVTGECDLDKLDVQYINQISVFVTAAEPRCMLQKVGPYLLKVHAGGDGFPRGAYPCHRNGH